MPKNENHKEWLNNYFDERNGQLTGSSQQIANECNIACGTVEFAEVGEGTKKIKKKANGVDASIVGRHMNARRKNANNEPRAKRYTEPQVKKLEAVYDKRKYPWVGDKMILMAETELDHVQVKNWFEQKARMAKKSLVNGGSSRHGGSNKNSIKMWTQYNRSEPEYLRKLKNGLISLKTGEAIMGDSTQHLESALNPANGHIESLMENDPATEVAEYGAHLMGNGMENGITSQNGYTSTAGPSQYPNLKNLFVRSKGQAEDSVDQKKLSHTNGTVGDIGSQMSSCHNYLGAGGSSNDYFDESPALYNGRIGAPLSKKNLSKDETFGIKTTSKGGRLMPAFMHQSTSDFVHPEHIDAITTNLGPNNRGGQSIIVNESLGESGWDYQMKEKSTVYREDVTKYHEAHESEQAGSPSSLMVSAAPLKKRKEALLEEATIDTRPSKRQRQPEERLGSGKNAQREHQFQSQRRYNELGIGESDIDGSIASEWAWLVNSRIRERDEWFDHGMQKHSGPPDEHPNHAHNTADPEGSLRCGYKESRSQNETNYLLGDRPESSIVMPHSNDEVGVARKNLSTANKTGPEEKQTIEEDLFWASVTGLAYDDLTGFDIYAAENDVSGTYWMQFI